MTDPTRQHKSDARRVQRHFERRDIDATALDHLLQPSAETDAAIRRDGSKIAGQKVPVAVERFGIELRRVEIAWRDATADGELADLTGIARAAWSRDPELGSSYREAAALGCSV